MRMRARAGWAALGYALVFGVLALRWLRTAYDSVPGAEPHLPAFAFGGDARLAIWVIGWVAHALADPSARLLDANIFYPLRGQLTGTEQFVSSQLLGVPLTWVTGNPVLAANVIVFLSYPLGALAMYGLLRAYGSTPLVAWTAGLAFALGPLRVPANIKLLQYLNLYLPLALFGLRRLRDDPRIRRAVELAIVLTAALLSSYYMAVMAAVTAAAYGAAEACRRRPGTVRFLVLAASAGGLALATLAAVSIPYFQRPEARFGTPVGNVRSMEVGDLPTALVILCKFFFGVVPSALAALGLLALVAGPPAARRAALAGVLVGAVGFVLLAAPPPLVAIVRASPLRFLRGQPRFTVIMGCGVALLTGAALELVRRLVPGRAGTALVAALAAAIVVTRGPNLSGVRDRIMAASVDAPVYEAVDDAARRFGRGPLLELPPWDAHRHNPRNPNLATEAMIGSFRHWLPLLTGHSAYPPAHRRLLDALLEALPRRRALDELVDLTGVRWLLLRPKDYWARPAVRDAILRLPRLSIVFTHEGWTLARIDRVSRHPEWIAALADGPQPGCTLLGTPLAALADADAVAVVDVAGAPPAVVRGGAVVPLRVRVTNAGGRTWPVLAPPGAAGAPVVHSVVRWRPIASGGDAAGRRERAFALRRDVLPGETLAETTRVAAPQTPGEYDLEIVVVQDGAARFDGPGNVPARMRIRVAPSLPGRGCE